MALIENISWSHWVVTKAFLGNGQGFNWHVPITNPWWCIIIGWLLSSPELCCTMKAVVIQEAAPVGCSNTELCLPLSFTVAIHDKKQWCPPSLLFLAPGTWRDEWTALIRDMPARRYTEAVVSCPYKPCTLPAGPQRQRIVCQQYQLEQRTPAECPSRAGLLQCQVKCREDLQVCIFLYELLISLHF